MKEILELELIEVRREDFGSLELIVMQCKGCGSMAKVVSHARGVPVTDDQLLDVRTFLQGSTPMCGPKCLEPKDGK